MFFLRTDQQSCEALKEILTKYETASGQAINTTKSSISFSSKTPQEIRLRIHSYLGIEKEGGVGKYLGLPEHFGRRKKDLFTNIVERIRQRASSWSSRRLSTAGKLVMLKAVLSAIPTYAMSCFLLPVSLCKRIQSALTRFWWDECEDKKKICWVSWERITKPKNMGGLGIRDIQLFNTALLAKQAWRIVTNPGTCFRVLLGKYCQKRPFLSAEATSDCSHGWKGIIAGRDLLRVKLISVIGDGEATKVWKDKWLSTITPQAPYGPAPEAYQDLVVADLLARDSKEWNIPLIEKVLPDLVDTIRALKPSQTGSRDGVAWLGSRSGCYTTRSGYYAAAETCNDLAVVAEPIEWKSLLWTGRISPKIMVFLWKATQGALPVGENLQKRGMLQHTTCIRCGETETVSHIFLHCAYAKKVWAKPLLVPHFDPDDFSSLVEALRSSKKSSCLPPMGVISDIVPWICWSLWTARNKAIFEGWVIPPEDTLSKAIWNAREWTSAQPLGQSPVLHHNKSLSIPDLDALVFCFSGMAWNKDSNTAAFGCIYKDNNDRIIHQATHVERHVSSPRMAEALALHWAITTALSQSFTRIWFKTDCQSLLVAILSKNPPADLYGIIQDIENLSLIFCSVSFKFVARRMNSLADRLAKATLCIVSRAHSSL
ncbi:hypothetical protein Bca101_084938 [Brassica carinata]